MIRDELELAEILESASSRDAAALMLACTETLNPVADHCGDAKWTERFEALRSALWADLEAGRPLGSHAREAQNLSTAMDALIHQRASDPVISTYGVAAQPLADVLHCLAHDEPAQARADAVIFAIRSLHQVFVPPQQQIVTGQEFAEFYAAHPSQLILRQALGVVLARLQSGCSLAEVRSDARAIGEALRASLPLPA